MSALAPSAEARVVLRNVSWATYEALLDARGEDPAPRFAFDRGTLEIMSPSGKHEWLKRLLGRFVETFTLERGIPLRSAGATTLKSQLKERGLEPDESYYVQNEERVRQKDDIDILADPPPDLSIEVDVSSSSLDKLGIYSNLGVPEVWSHDGRSIVIHVLESSGEYSASDQSRALKGLRAEDLNRFLEKRHETDETSLVKSFGAWARKGLRAR